jgi:hypothetical protein
MNSFYNTNHAIFLATLFPGALRALPAREAPDAVNSDSASSDVPSDDRLCSRGADIVSRTEPRNHSASQDPQPHAEKIKGEPGQ